MGFLLTTLTKLPSLRLRLLFDADVELLEEFEAEEKCEELGSIILSLASISVDFSFDENLMPNLGRLSGSSSESDESSSFFL